MYTKSTRLTQKSTLILTLVLLGLTATTGGCTKGPVSFYVSPAGNDEWSGEEPVATTDSDQGPFATLERARDAVRDVKSRGRLPPGGVTVYVRGGTYLRDRTFRLSSEDGGVEGSPVIYQAFENERPRLQGGAKLRDWNAVEDPDIRARLPADARDHVVQSDLAAAGVGEVAPLVSRGFRREISPSHTELYFQGRRMTLARWPNEEFTEITGFGDRSPQDDGHGTLMASIEHGFHYAGDRPKGWGSQNDIWVHGYWAYDWANTYEAVDVLDTRRRFVRTHPPYGIYGYMKGQHFFWLNVLEELDQPGEYYVDRDTKTVYFWPPALLEEEETLVSMLGEPFVAIENAEHITIQGFTFEYSRSDGIAVNDSSHIKILGSIIRNIGNRGILVMGGRENEVRGADIYQTGDGAVFLDGGDRKSLTPGSHSAVNNHIHHIGEWTRTYQPGVAVRGVGHQVAHNLIHDGPHNAVQLQGNDHVIEFNEIHHVCLETGDVGGFYMGRDWTEQGNVIRHNFFHHLDGIGLGSMAVYLDDCASGTQVVGNVFYETQRAVLIGGGRNTLVENNVFVDTEPAIYIDGRCSSPREVWRNMTYKTMRERLDAMNHHEAPYSERDPRLKDLDAYYAAERGVPPEGNQLRRNIIVGTGADDGSWLLLRRHAERSMIELKDNLVGTDPLFVDADNMNFQLREESPAFGLGFEKIPFEKIGLQIDDVRTELPVQ